MIIFHKETGQFHLCNERISYIIQVLKNGHLGQLYYGARVDDREDFSEYTDYAARYMTSYVYEGDWALSLEHMKQEYPVFGTSDYREPAVEIVQENGSRISDFQYREHRIYKGKERISGLPACYVSDEGECDSLEIVLFDAVSGIELCLCYSIFRDVDVIARSAGFGNMGSGCVYLNRAMSLNLDLPDMDYEMVQFSGAWSRERHVKTRLLTEGIQSVGSNRGISSANHNPALLLKRRNTTENLGTAMGFTFLYSGNFLAQVEVTTHEMSRVQVGIHPDTFCWRLEPGEEFHTPEGILAWSQCGLDGLSQTFHQLFRRHVIRGYWKEQVRPIPINNWEATYFDFDEEKLLALAERANEIGIELFVLDDGWFGRRNGEHGGLGDWSVNREKIPSGLKGLVEKIKGIGMDFGIWIEPEMVSKDSDLYQQHPEWVLHVPERKMCHGRNQYVLDFSNPEVVDHIFAELCSSFQDCSLRYIKWDMNRCLTECYSAVWPPERQGEIYHRYMLGVYRLYEQMIQAFPEVLFESCASGGARFDPGMLHYAPQGWTSDNNDAPSRVKIQYGTSYLYPLCTMGAHVSKSPNAQLNREVRLKTRADVAYFGTFGYELNLLELTQMELNEMKTQVAFMKQYREVIQNGDFHRLASPFEKNTSAWMAVGRDKRQAVIGIYRELNEVNAPFRRIYPYGLLAAGRYRRQDNGGIYTGRELMNMGISLADGSCGLAVGGVERTYDFDSRLIVLEMVE